MQHHEPPPSGFAGFSDKTILNGSIGLAERILVINPNSTEVVTRGIDEAVEPLRMAGGAAVDCVTLKEGPGVTFLRGDDGYSGSFPGRLNRWRVVQ
jgi:hypothetical protein